MLRRVRYTVIAALTTCLPHPALAQSVPAAPTQADETAGQGTEIVVTARRRGTTETLDRTVYDIQTGPEAASSSTVDVLKRLPGVTVGASGRVSIRAGARVSYLIDGKPVREAIALAVPASQIDRVEIIANPSAEFDSGSEALVNLILKRNAHAGWSGAVSAKADTLGGARAGLDVARGGDAWTVNANLSFQSGPLRTRALRRTEFRPTGSPQIIQTLETDNRTTRNRLSGQVKLSRDSASGNKASIVLGGSFNTAPQREGVVETTRVSGTETASLLRRRLYFRGFYPFANLSAERKLGGGFELQPGLNVFAGRSLDRRRTEGALNQLSREDLSFMFIEPGATVIKSTKLGLLSVGATFSANPVRSRLQLGDAASGTGPGRQDTKFRFNRDQLALFASYELKVLGLEAKPALRFERMAQRFSEGTRRLDGLRSVTRILPSLHVSGKVDKWNVLKASFTTRTEKPDAVNLNPFRKFTSPFFAEQGNPFLRPSTKKQFDLTHIYDRKTLTFTQSLYYRDTTDDITRFVFSDDTGLTTSSFANLGSSRAYGYSASAKVGLVKNLQVGAGADLYHKRIVAPTSLQTLGRVAFYGVNVNGTVDLTIDRKSSLSAQFSYEGRTLELGLATPSYTTSEVQYTRKLSKRLSLNLVAADVGVPLERTGRFSGVNLTGAERSRRGSRLLRIGLASTF